MSSKIFSASKIGGFDVIGDVHGCYSALVRLLEKLGYEPSGEGYVYPDNKRKLIFVGDLIDRGAEIKKTLALVKSCCDFHGAQVVIGNHEFNAIAYFKTTQKGYLREHTERNASQLAATLEQFSGDIDLLNGYLGWFETLPLFLDLPAFRVVHACWDQANVDYYRQRFGSCSLVPALFDAFAAEDARVMACIRRLTRGINLPCPKEQQILGQDGLLRSTFRAKFWAQSIPEVYEDIVFQPDPLPSDFSKKPVSDADLKKLIYYSSHEKPLFVGHYWLKGKPKLVAKNIACLDYSAVSGGQLVAYRYHLGDNCLDESQFVAVGNSALL